ncbi:DUF397 domain-containing protein, partial [Patulibacter sp. NPDC049589]|uniref:DUF397 domain-containing protein n=1 Tax=Patulibacter sp. NPDC049589 TaxID=3154731 RepID=UPI00341C15F7
GVVVCYSSRREFHDMPDLSVAAWRKSTRCVSDHHCVEVADLGDDVGVRNSQRPQTALVLPKAAWRDLIDGITRGDFA